MKINDAVMEYKAADLSFQSKKQLPLPHRKTAAPT